MKKAIWRSLLSIQIKQFHWLLCVAKEFWLVQENHVTVKLDSSVAPHGVKTYSKSKIELRNIQILKKMLENREGFCHQSSPVSWKAWTLPWILQESKKYARNICSCGLRLEVIQFEFWMKEALATVEICVLCGWRFLNHFDILPETPYSCDTVGCEL